MAGPGLQQTANTVLLGRQSPAFVPLGPGEHPGGPLHPAVQDVSQVGSARSHLLVALRERRAWAQLPGPRKSPNPARFQEG